MKLHLLQKKNQPLKGVRELGPLIVLGFFLPLYIPLQDYILIHHTKERRKLIV